MPEKPAKPPRRQSLPGRECLVGAVLLVACLLTAVGCHRDFYRRQADLEAYYLIEEKNTHIARPSETALRIDVDRRSRMFNPFDLDFQPMPLDDPASYRYMQCVDGRRGYPMWEAAGVTNTSQSPDWWQFLPLDENGVLVLNSENAVRIALLHSPEYQRQLENIYLSALAVSVERFQFDTQFFGGANTFFETLGPNRTGAGESSTTVSVGPFSVGRRDLALQRRFATGADLVVGVANNIVWELSGPNSQSATTVLDFSLVQPLLRRAGRDRVLESLTFAERSLLANIRAFERYRRSFFLNITIGRGLESRPGVNGPQIDINGNVSSNAGGFIGLVQTQLQIRNSEENIARLKESLVILEDSLVESLTTIPDTGNITQIIQDRLQVEQTRSRLLNAEQSLIRQQASFQSDVDAFLRTLGLPPYICVRIQDPFLDGFELIDPELRGRREQLSVVRSNIGTINLRILDLATEETDDVTNLQERLLEWTPELAAAITDLRDSFAPIVGFNEILLAEDLPTVREDLQRFVEALPQRREQNQALLELYRLQQQKICTLLDLSGLDESVFQVTELDELGSELREGLDLLETQFQQDTDRITQLFETLNEYAEQGPGDATPEEIAERLRDDVILASQELLSEIGDDVLALQLIQARARTESVLLPEVDLNPETAVEIARRNRRDWANARAALVDSWRLIEFTADDLESTLDLVFSGDTRNVGNNPFDLRGNAGRLTVGLQWDAPITRLIERNDYRSVLIDYERARRDYYLFEDSVWQLLRNEIRQLQANRLNFELGRQQLRVAAAQIELNEDRRAAREARGQSAGPTAARDIIEALDGLLNAQNDLLQIFVSNEVVRRGLYFDLGTMELTPDGLWIDPGGIEADFMLGLDGTTAPSYSCNCFNDCGLPLRRLPLDPSSGMIEADDDEEAYEPLDSPPPGEPLVPLEDRDPPSIDYVEPSPSDRLGPEVPDASLDLEAAEPGEVRRLPIPEVPPE